MPDLKALSASSTHVRTSVDVEVVTSEIIVPLAGFRTVTDLTFIVNRKNCKYMPRSHAELDAKLLLYPG